MELSTRARRRLSTILALVLAAESVSAVSVAATSVQTSVEAPNAGPARVLTAAVLPPVLVRTAVADQADAGSTPWFAPHVVELPDRPAPKPVVAEVPAPKPAVKPHKVKAAVTHKAAKPRPAAKPAPKPAAKPAPKPAPKPAAKPVPKPKATPKPPTYSGTNHVWIPSLGISRSVHWFPCDRSRPPDNYMYRWGCAGANNVYLMGHAYSVMKPLHDAYVRGRLKVGMKAYYAGANGRVHAYAVRWWKLTRPTTDAAWAWAAQSAPSMTLQTCVGANSEWRLMVRLVEVG
jgi:hypothetical protein